MLSYDPEVGPDRAAWLASDEQERRSAVTAAHAGVRLAAGEDRMLHALVHVIVENRLAEDDPPACEAYERLRAAGLDRHTTLHALGSVVSLFIVAALHSDEADPADLNAGFALLDPADWRPRPGPTSHVARPYLGRKPKPSRRR
jgi:hypothetical protein